MSLCHSPAAPGQNCGHFEVSSEFSIQQGEDFARGACRCSERCPKALQITRNGSTHFLQRFLLPRCPSEPSQGILPGWPSLGSAWSFPVPPAAILHPCQGALSSALRLVGCFPAPGENSRVCLRAASPGHEDFHEDFLPIENSRQKKGFHPPGSSGTLCQESQAPKHTCASSLLLSRLVTGCQSGRGILESSFLRSRGSPGRALIPPCQQELCLPPSLRGEMCL